MDTLLFSIFYHDIIYNPLRSDNEYKSAAVFKKRISQTSFQHINKCIEQIELTKEHKITKDNDINILLDLDLSILGKSKIKYREYHKNIRKEYAMFSDEEYNCGRKEVLTRILGLPTIYKTDYFIAKYEEKARDNLTHELNSFS